MSAFICVIEDEPDLATLMVDYLKANDFQTIVFNRGDEADLWLQSNNPDLILLDLMLPGMDGLQVCKNQRQRSAVPIIMMTAKTEEIDRLLGLELGADDYICKPYSAREVVARVKAVLRRMCVSAPVPAGAKPSVTLDEQRMSVRIFDQPVELTSVEFQLFSLLYSQPGRIFSRQYILDNIYQDYRVVGDRTVDGHIKKLRKKLNEANEQVELIRSVYGCGYKYEAP
ncbi:response regulator [Cellvibrio sp. KY-GH-1]|uniref:response regulator n=1 Tax=Cellvibrio sp. KY-GH-1 TaxID=2303332 RepID=UPI0012486118|nr:response regulator [Cellvibrio sp. KY-GH-1]QEY17585.1 response regulator [Cellvibrio sp. KY-GH-1]